MSSSILHIFNLEHDLALANNDNHFVAPHVARQMRSDLSFIPVLWAKEGDIILVDDIDTATRAVRTLHRQLPRVTFATVAQLSSLRIDGVSVWGWDKSLLRELRGSNIDAALLPSAAALQTIRRLSSRSFAMTVLGEMCSRIEGLCGESAVCHTIDEIHEYTARWNHVVMKAPWSSSGRGIRFAEGSVEEPLLGWCKNILKKQEIICVEPYYHQVRDFGMEFESDGKGKITYCGLSLFKTENGTYTGNIVATERVKYEMISKYISVSLLKRVRDELQLILGDSFNGPYCGPFGVDMMIVAAGEGRGFTVHPCVEINLRRTMGHVALSLTPDGDDTKYLMKITNTNNNYQVRLTK